MQLMKTLQFTQKSIIALLAFALLLPACKEKIEGEIGEPYDKVAGMNGTWELTNFIQKDLNNPVKEERDLSSFYIQGGITPLQLTFDSNDRSYDVALELGKNYFGTGGTWAFDDDLYPSIVILFDETDTLQFDLGRMVRTFDNTLSIELPRGCGLGTADATETVVYKFEFTRVNL